MSTVTVEEASPKLIFGRFRFWLFMVGLVVILTGVLFGYDQGVISGALQFITKAFHLSTTLQEVVTSWVTLGALVGALLAGGLADRLGRQRAMIIGGILFAVGALGESLAPGTWILVISRFVVGFGVGIASVARCMRPRWLPRPPAAGMSPATSWPSRSASCWPTSPTRC